jgi:hypothetical protein
MNVQCMTVGLYCTTTTTYTPFEYSTYIIGLVLYGNDSARMHSIPFHAMPCHADTNA